MTELPTGEREILDPRLTDGEEVEVVSRGGDQTVVVTDRRVASFSVRTSDRRSEVSYRDLLLTDDRIIGTSFNAAEESRTGPGWIGGLIAFFGLLVAALAAVVDGDAQGIVLGLGFVIVLVGIGIYVLLSGEETVGENAVTIRRVGDYPNATWEFPEGADRMAEAISKRVAEAQS
jgi:hypothetical protein